MKHFLTRIAAALTLALSAALFAPMTGANITMAHAQEVSPATWLVTALITNAAGESLYEPLYFQQSNPERRFATEAACKAFIASDDPVFVEANADLRRRAAAQLGPDARVEFKCTVESS